MNDAGMVPSPRQNAAWASFQTPLSTEQLSLFCQDIERLFRINPYLEFATWKKIADNRYLFRGRNLSQQPAFDFEHLLSVEQTADAIIIRYDHGIKQSTTLKIESAPAGSKLTITDDYHRNQDEPQTDLHDVDKSLIKWAQDLQRFIIMWQRWSWLRPWRWYIRRVWQPLKPMSRRIVYMFIWISIVEIALIILGGVIYWLEYR